MSTPHPEQPLIVSKDNVVRFKENKIVSYLLDFATNRGCGLNELAMMNFSDEDRIQLAQLIGYSASGFQELHYVDADTAESVDRKSRELAKQKHAKVSPRGEVF